MHIIKLHKGREQSVLRRHPWIFSRAIQSATKGLADGDTGVVQDAKDHVLGTGHYQDSSLAIRLLAFEEVTTDLAF